MKKNRYLLILLCFVLIAALLTGCGASSADGAYENAKAETMAELAPMEAADVASSTSLSEYSDPNAKLIRTVELEAQTKEYDALMTSVEEKITALDGYIENRDAYNGSEYYGRGTRYCSMVIRVPADRLDEFVTHVNENANVVSSNESVENITLQYADTAARVEALETEQNRLLELLESAQNLTEILEIEARLSEVRYELESYASQLKIMDNQVTYATVHLYIDEVEKLTPVEKPSVWERISEGFGQTLSEIADAAVEFFVWFVVNLPWIVIWGGLAAVVVLIIKITDRKTRAKRRQRSIPTDEPKE